MSSATPQPYNVRYNADTGTLQYEFPTGWIDVPSSGGGTPAGATGNVQYNSSGSFAADPLVNMDGSGGLLLGGVAGDGTGLQFVNNGTLESSLAQNTNTNILKLAQFVNGQIIIETSNNGTPLDFIYDIDGSLTVPGHVAFGAAGDVGMYIVPGHAGGSTLVAPNVDAVNSTNFTMADQTTSILSINSQDVRVGIGTTTPTQLLDVSGNVRIDGQIAMGPASPSSACLIDMINPFVGLGVPVMSTAQKNAVTPNRAGNVVFDTDLGKLCVNNGTAWETITSV